MLFMYWTHEEIELPPAFPAWKSLYPGFSVFNDSDVIPLLPANFVDLYNKIRLPSAKSDIARLLLLRKYGGFYIDAHIGPTSSSALLETIEELSRFNLILFGKGWVMQHPTDFDLMNGVLAARKGVRELDIVIDRVIANIVEQARKENECSDYIPYSLFGVTGTYTLIQSFFEQGPQRQVIREEFHDTVHVHFMKDNEQSGFAIASYYNYRKPGGHWSERQSNERFFI